ncbi:hypothetical protein ACQJBY_043415 [Aegilops geniculata]
MITLLVVVYRLVGILLWHIWFYRIPPSSTTSSPSPTSTAGTPAPRSGSGRLTPRACSSALCSTTSSAPARGAPRSKLARASDEAVE